MEKMAQDIKNVIEEAIKLEIRGKEFFNQAAEITHNELGKKMFLKLAQEEVRHLEAFGKLFSSTLKSEDWKKIVRQEELKGSSAVIEDLVSRMKKAEGKSEVEALRIGMELEQKAVDFFSESSKKSSDPQAQEIFNKICEEERFHFDLLQAQMDSLTQSGFWLDSSEFQMDGKY